MSLFSQLGRRFGSFARHVPQIRLPVTTNAPRFTGQGLKEVLKPIERPRVPSTSSSGAPMVPMSEPYPVSGPDVTVSHDDPTLARVSSLPNGVRVATLNRTLGVGFSGVGVFLMSGSRVDPPDAPGTSHLYARMGFKSTQRRTGEQIVSQLESMGVTFMAHSSRESIQYVADFMGDHLEEVVALLGENLCIPLFDEQELETQRMVMQYEREDLERNAALYLPELLHEAAYGRTTLGLPTIPAADLAARAPVTRETLLRYHAENVVGPRVVLAGVSVPHDQLLALARRHFSAIPAAPPAATPFRFAPAVYRAGDVRVPQWCAPPDTPDVKHVAVAWRAPSWHDPRLYAVCVLQQLLGGGSSFSAGGPGKGMYSRMYRRVLGLNGDFESAAGVFSSYEDSGLMAVQGSAPADVVPDLVREMLKQMRELTKFYPSPTELTRAKNMLKSVLMMNLEHRSVALEDLGRQILTYGEREPAHVTCEKIDRVTEQDVTRLVRDLLNEPISLAVLGSVPRLQTREQMREMLFAP